MPAWVLSSSCHQQTEVSMAKIERAPLPVWAAQRLQAQAEQKVHAGPCQQEVFVVMMIE